MFGTSPLGTAVLGGTSGGFTGQITSFDFIVVDRIAISTAIDFIVQATITKTASLDMIIAGSGIKFFALDLIVVEKEKDNLPYYQAVGNNLSIAIDPSRPAVWSTATRPAAPLLWQEGLNTQTGIKEYWDGSIWRKSSDGTAA